ncbi:hypothetical protein Nepgr_020698 [Nepenthes gracilis]|uniref:Ribosomal protein eL8/eL30/eS12/Gadd45 domain-containing protein n=1 Tax=Nepenthes gracilis TaxID=150966 RepID=A0AAD3SYG5_NEPGR|nr:hypothetical protein Nepgr_020698 [Nepenthes gracilis]
MASTITDPIKLLKDSTKKRISSKKDKDMVTCFEGEDLSRLLKSMEKEIEVERCSNKTLPNKLWIKQQFAVGVNEVTRALERMPPSTQTSNQRFSSCGFQIRLQAVLVAWDCNPRWLIKHLPALAASRNVPVIYVKDKKQGSIRLGELIKLKTAIAIGVKAKGNSINQLVERILCGKYPGKEMSQ